MFEELVPLAKFTQLSVLGTSDTVFLALFYSFFSQQFVEGADVAAEVFGVTRKHRFILPGQLKLAMLNVTYKCIRPKRR